ncbi:MAG: Ig-like domain-containing protein [Pseudomonadota bacterium]
MTFLSSLYSSISTLFPTIQVPLPPLPFAPVAGDDGATTQAGTSVTIDVLANDMSLFGQALTVTSVTAGEFGTALVNTDGTITYTPNSGTSGTDTLTYTVRDVTGAETTATVTVTVTPEPISVAPAPVLFAPSPSTGFGIDMQQDFAPIVENAPQPLQYFVRFGNGIEGASGIAGGLFGEEGWFKLDGFAYGAHTDILPAGTPGMARTYFQELMVSLESGHLAMARLNEAMMTRETFANVEFMAVRPLSSGEVDHGAMIVQKSTLSNAQLTSSGQKGVDGGLDQVLSIGFESAEHQTFTVGHSGRYVTESVTSVDIPASGGILVSGGGVKLGDTAYKGKAPDLTYVLRFDNGDWVEVSDFTLQSLMDWQGKVQSSPLMVSRDGGGDKISVAFADALANGATGDLQLEVYMDVQSGPIHRGNLTLLHEYDFGNARLVDMDNVTGQETLSFTFDTQRERHFTQSEFGGIEALPQNDFGWNFTTQRADTPPVSAETFKTSAVDVDVLGGPEVQYFIKFGNGIEGNSGIYGGLLGDNGYFKVDGFSYGRSSDMLPLGSSATPQTYFDELMVSLDLGQGLARLNQAMMTGEGFANLEFVAMTVGLNGEIDNTSMVVQKTSLGKAYLTSTGQMGADGGLDQVLSIGFDTVEHRTIALDSKGKFITESSTWEDLPASGGTLVGGGGITLGDTQFKGSARDLTYVLRFGEGDWIEVSNFQMQSLIDWSGKAQTAPLTVSRPGADLGDKASIALSEALVGGEIADLQLEVYADQLDGALSKNDLKLLHEFDFGNARVLSQTNQSGTETLEFTFDTQHERYYTVSRSGQTEVLPQNDFGWDFANGQPTTTQRPTETFETSSVGVEDLSSPTVQYFISFGNGIEGFSGVRDGHFADGQWFKVDGFAFGSSASMFPSNANPQIPTAFQELAINLDFGHGMTRLNEALLTGESLPNVQFAAVTTNGNGDVDLNSMQTQQITLGNAHITSSGMGGFSSGLDKVLTIGFESIDRHSFTVDYKGHMVVESQSTVDLPTSGGTLVDGNGVGLGTTQYKGKALDLTYMLRFGDGDWVEVSNYAVKTLIDYQGKAQSSPLAVTRDGAGDKISGAFADALAKGVTGDLQLEVFMDLNGGPLQRDDLIILHEYDFGNARLVTQSNQGGNETLEFVFDTQRERYTTQNMKGQMEVLPENDFGWDFVGGRAANLEVRQETFQTSNVPFDELTVDQFDFLV